MSPTDTPDIAAGFGQIAVMNKGDEIDLNKAAPGLKNVIIGLGWDAPPETEGLMVDIDASAFLLNRDGRVRQDTDFIFYNNLETEQGCIKHLGDAIGGEAEGDDEEIHLDLEMMPYDVEKIAFAVTIHNASERKQTFGIIKNAFIRIVNEDTKVEIARFDLSEDASEQNAMVFGELEREGMGWKFKAIGTGHDGGLYKIAHEYGVNVAPN